MCCLSGLFRPIVESHNFFISHCHSPLFVCHTNGLRFTSHLQITRSVLDCHPNSSPSLHFRPVGFGAYSRTATEAARLLIPRVVPIESGINCQKVQKDDPGI